METTGWIRGLLLLLLLLLKQGFTFRHCSAVEYFPLANINKELTLKTPIHFQSIEVSFNSLTKQLKIQEEFIIEKKFQGHDTKKHIHIPNKKFQGKTITTSRTLCFKKTFASATIQDIVESNILKTIQQVVSVSYLMMKKTHLECNIIDRIQTNKDCWETLSKIPLQKDLKQMKEFMRKHQFGLIGVIKGKLELLSDTECQKCVLPCISYPGNKTISKWEVMRNNYLVPKWKKVNTEFKMLKRLIGNNREQSRSKRSLMSAIFGFASTDETAALRTALRTELDNQQATNEAMETLLKQQILAAEKINTDNKILFNIKQREKQLEGSVKSLTEYLENALHNSSSLAENNENDIHTIFLIHSITQKLDFLEKQISLVLDLINCPFGQCVRYVTNLLEENDIGQKETRKIIAETLSIQIRHNAIDITVQNITLSKHKTYLVKCIPFIQKGPKVMNYQGLYSMENKTGKIFKIPASCITKTNTILCNEEPTWTEDKCFQNIVSGSNKYCTQYDIIEANEVFQDFIQIEGILEIYSKEEDIAILTTNLGHRREVLREGITQIEIGKNNTMLNSKYLKVSFNKQSNKKKTQILIDMEDQPKEENWTENNKTKVNTIDLEAIKYKINHIGERPVEGSMIEVPTLVQLHPVAIYLADPTSSWWVYTILACVLVSTGTLGCYCKFRRRSYIRTPTEDLELQPRHNKNTQLCDLSLQNLLVGKEITGRYKNNLVRWTGTHWIDVNEKRIEEEIIDPPSYMTLQLKTMDAEIIIVETELGNFEITLKDCPGVKYDKVRCRWLIRDNKINTFRVLPEYILEKPTQEILNQLENKSRKQKGRCLQKHS